MKLILASTSPNRKELMDRMGIQYELRVPDYEEVIERDKSAFDQVQQFAEGKALSVQGPPDEDHLVMGFDSMIYFEGQSLGKAQSEEEAIEVLKSFVGKPQEIVTGFCLHGIYNGKAFKITDYQSTPVKFRDDVTEDEIKKYLTFGDWEGKCGAYSILGPGIFFLESLEGDFQNIVGIPVIKIGHHIKNLTGKSWVKLLSKK